MGEPVYVSIAEAAERIGCTNETVVNLLKRGALRGNDASNMRRTYVDRESLDVFCTAIPDYESQLEEIKALKKVLKDTREELEVGIIQNQFMSWRDSIEINKRFFDAVAGICLAPRDGEILLSAINGCPYSVIAEKFGLPRTRIRQIIEKSLRRLRQVPKYNTLCGLLEHYRELISMKNKELLEGYSDDSSLNYTPIPLEQFTARAQNVIRSIGISTIGDLINNPKNSLMNMRNMGRKTLREIDSFMQTLGPDIYTNWIK